MSFTIESKPRKPWLPPFRVTLLYADDATGLLPEEIFAVLELLPGNFKLTLVELAFDFTGLTINRNFVRLNGLFGRSGRARSSDEADYWGTRQSGKLTKSYFKAEVGAHRVEFEFRSRFLRRYHVESPLDFPKLLSLIPGRHLLFAQLNNRKLIDNLNRSMSEKELFRHRRWVDPARCNTGAALYYMREQLHLCNLRRFLTPLGANQLVREALKKWCELWDKPAHTLNGSSGKNK